MGCPNCKCNKGESGGCCNKMSEEEYLELKEHLEESIKAYSIIDYIDKNEKPNRFVEVEFDEYILEVENIETNGLTKEKLIDFIIKNNMA